MRPLILGREIPASAIQSIEVSVYGGGAVAAITFGWDDMSGKLEIRDLATIRTVLSYMAEWVEPEDNNGDDRIRSGRTDRT